MPDVAGWRRERLPAVPDAPFLELAPDSVCEVLFPSTALKDRRNNMPIYAREGVRHLWLVDSLRKSLEVYRLESERYVAIVTHGESEVARVEPFEAIALELEALWPAVP